MTQTEYQVPRAISRREFLVQLAALAAPLTGLLAGCGPSGQSASAPAPTQTLAPTRSVLGTTASTAVATAVSAAGPSPTPTLRPVPPRPELVRFYPDVPSRVVHARHAGVWAGEDLVPGAIRQMLDAAITKLTGLNDAGEAWAALFKPHERIAIKVNTIEGSSAWTHAPLALAVAECLQEAGVPAEQIIIYDRRTDELRSAGFPINLDGPGVRCHGTNNAPLNPRYASGFTLAERRTGLSSILLNCDALINVPILKQHMYAGTSFAMKNHYGTIYNPAAFHPPRTGPAIADLNALAPIRDRTRLIVGDMLEVVLGDNWHAKVTGDAISMSFDPVAHDAAAVPLWSEIRKANDGDPTGYQQMANVWLEKSAELGLGTHDPANMDLVEVSLA